MPQGSASKYTGPRRSAENILLACRRNRAVINKVWSTASKAPIFSKVHKNAKTGKETTRRPRLVRRDVFMTVSSGAAQNVANILESEGNKMKLEQAYEKKNCAWTPRLSEGACIQIEQFLAALASDAHHRAAAVARACATTPKVDLNASTSYSRKQISTAHMELGWASTNRIVFAAAVSMPAEVSAPLMDGLIRLTKKKVAKKESKKEKRATTEDECVDLKGDYCPADEQAGAEKIGDVADLAVEDD